MSIYNEVSWPHVGSFIEDETGTWFVDSLDTPDGLWLIGKGGVERYLDVEQIERNTFYTL